MCTKPIKKGKYLIKQTYTFSAVRSTVGILPGLYAQLFSISEIVNKLIYLGLRIKPSVQSKIRLPKTVSIIVR